MLQDPKSGVLGPVGIGAQNTTCRNENPYRVPWHIFFENIIVLTTLKWAPTFSTIYYEQVALLHPPAQPTSLRWNWGFFAQTCSTYRNDSSGAHPCRAIDRAWEPRIPSPCSLKAITHAIGSIIGSSWSRWNRSIEYYPVGMKTHIEYPDVFF